MNFLFTNIAYASGESVGEFMDKVDTFIINPLILLLFALAVVYFLYGIVEFISNAQNEEKKTAGKSHMIWGIVGIGIMMAVFTLMHIVLNTLNIKGVDPENGKVQLDDYNPPSSYTQ